MEAKLSIQNYGEGRKEISISIALSEEEKKILKEKPCQQSIDTPKAVPCTFYLSPDPNNKMCRGLPLWNKEPLKSYFLQSSRRVLHNRPIPNKTHLRIQFPGELNLGFINPNDEEALAKWWINSVKPEFVNRLKELLFETKFERDYKPTELRNFTPEPVNLNPIDPNEKKGVRKRCIDIY